MSRIIERRDRIAGCRLAHTAVAQGDTRSSSIAAASIVAKLTRDSLMIRYGRLYPEYEFDRHKGYATRAHLDVLKRREATELHRRSFGPVAMLEIGQLNLTFNSPG